MDQNIRITRAKEEDAEGIRLAYEASVSLLCANHYTPHEIAALIACRVPGDDRSAEQDKIALVAAMQGQVVGYAEIRKEDGELRALFVHPRHARSGIGGMLLKMVETEARRAGCREALIDATLNSVPFFLNRGYTFRSEGTFSAPGGESIPCVRMQRSLGPAAG